MTTLEKFKIMLEDTCPEVCDPAPNHRIPGDPWRSYRLVCGSCNGVWEENQKQGTKGVICPYCGKSHEDVIF